MSEAAFISSRPQLKVAGEVREDMQEALTNMVVNLPLHGCAHAELHLTNWGRPEGEEEPDFVFNDIGLGSECELLMGEEDPVAIFTGEVTAIEERYGEGSPFLALLLQDKLHRLARSRNNRSFEDQSPDDVVRTIASDAGLSADVDVSNLVSTWHQLNESDLAFLQRLLSRFDIALRLEGGRLRAKVEEADSDAIELDAQDSALRVRLMVDLNNQWLSSTTQGYNVADAVEVNHTSASMTPAPEATTARITLNQLSWPGDEVMPQPFARSSAEAQAYAKAHFRRQAKRFVQGEIVCQGEASLKSGREIELNGVSPRLQGKYQVVHCVHQFDNNSGFETHLKVNRADWRV